MANPFSDILSKFFPAQKATSVIGIDVGSSSVKVVQVKKKGGKAVLETYGEIALGPYAQTDLGRATILPADKVSEAIKDLLREANTTTTDSGLSIPIGSSFIVFMKLPKSAEKNLAEMVPIEARKYIPVPVTEVSMDWWQVPHDESTVSEFQNGKAAPDDGMLEILLIVITNDAIAKNKDIEKNSALATSFSEVEIFSTMRSVLEPGLAPQMIIDFGAGSTKVFVVEKGILKASHVINRGAQDITLAISKSMNIPFADAEKMKRAQGITGTGANGVSILQVSSVTTDYIFAEIGRFVMDYYRKSGKKLSKIVLAGGGALLKGLPEKAKSSFDAPVEVADPFAKLEYPAFLEATLHEAGPEFAVAIGIAVRKLQEL